MKVGSNVSFVYNGERVRGVVRFLGQTDFSTSILCGVELSGESDGKHNGTVKGKRYFECPNNRGVFVPLKKITLLSAIPLYGNFKPSKDFVNKRNNVTEVVQESKDSIEPVKDKAASTPEKNPPQLTLLPQTPKVTATTSEEEGDEDDSTDNEVNELEEAEEEDSDEMRITIRSYKTSETKQSDDSPITTTTKSKESIERNPSSNSSCDSGIESPTRKVSKGKSVRPSERRSFRSSKSKLGRISSGRNIVVSSYTTPTPKKPILFNSFDEGSSSDLDNSKTGSPKSESPMQIIQGKQKSLIKNTSFAEDIDSDVFEKEMNEGVQVDRNTSHAPVDRSKIEVAETPQEATISTPLLMESEDLPPSENEESKIPLPKRTTSTKVLEKFEQERLKSKSPSFSVSRSAKMFEKLEQEKSSQIPFHKNNRDKSSPLLSKQRTIKPMATVTPLGKPTSTGKTATTTSIPATKTAKTITGIARSRPSSRITISSEKSSVGSKKADSLQGKTIKAPFKRSK